MSRIGFQITESLAVGDGAPLLLLAGPCVIEDLDLCLQVARTLKQLTGELGIGYVFKASFDKANRTSVDSYRGPGLKDGLTILQRVKDEVGVPIVTDIHEAEQAEPAATVADILQIPAFLCRQTDLLVAAGRTGCVVNVKKGQFMAPGGMRPTVEKVRSTGNDRVMLTERGSSFGYGNLVVDMRGLAQMRALGVPVIFDATHSVQLPGGLGTASGGERQYAPVLLRAAAAAGVDGFFIETHPAPEKALCDGPNSLPLDEMSEILKLGKAIHGLVRGSRN